MQIGRWHHLAIRSYCLRSILLLLLKICAYLLLAKGPDLSNHMTILVIKLKVVATYVVHISIIFYFERSSNTVTTKVPRQRNYKVLHELPMRKWKPIFDWKKEILPLFEGSVVTDAGLEH